MPWFNVDDGFHSHPKAGRAGDEAIGMWARAGAYCMHYLTDGFIDESWVRMQPRGIVKAKRLVDAGLWIPVERDGEKGWVFHDWDESQRSKSQVQADRRASVARQEVARNPELRDAVKVRDGDRCRYCGLLVEWSNRRGPGGGTYDHVIPSGGTTLANLVVCCRGCNAKKGRRTPEQAGMKLLPPKSDSSQIQNKDRSEQDTHPNQANTNDPLESLGGGLTLVDAREPRPQCPDHETNSPDPCPACLRRRKWDDENADAIAADELVQKRRQREIAAACPRCHGTNVYDIGEDQVAKCWPHIDPQEALRG